MRAKVAVATMQGKAYFYIVSLLKENNIPFFSLIPGEPIPAEVKVVITTVEEKTKITYGRVLSFTSEDELDSLLSAITINLQGKDRYDKIVIGIDPGEVNGLAVIGDGKLVDKANCLSIREINNKLKSILKNVNLSATLVKIKIGNGVPAYKELIEALDNTLPPKVVLEVVSEAGTNLPLSKRSRGLRHITSATRIAARAGYIYQRRERNQKDETNS
ncbi:MAG: hypothetical protein ACQCN5_12015 [Candidatus Bathyarchaeia archaeon]|jgi:hypothetical protein